MLATRVPWPLHGAYRDWPEQVARPLRAIARRNARARALLRRPFPGSAAEAVLEERYARELLASLGGEPELGPRFVFGASGLTLSGLAAGWEECVEWDIGELADAGYSPELVGGTIAAVRTDLDAFGEAEQSVLENHGYLVADAALRKRGLAAAGGIEAGPPEPPHPRWMSERRVREELQASSRRTPLGRIWPRRSRRRAAAGEPGSAELTALLERHRPFLRYDSLESLRADPVEAICSVALPGRSNTLHRADGSLLAAVEPRGEEPRLDIDFLNGGAYPTGEPARPGDYLDECGGSHAADAALLRRRAGHTDVAYGHARRGEEGRLWLQYWFFFYCSDRGLLGLEQHEGDWSCVQIRLGAGGAPEAATLIRQGTAVALDWRQLELAASGEGPVPVVYPARGSHAPLPRPGSFRAPVVPDHSDGLGPRLRPRLVPIGDDGPGWVLWPGRWGATLRREYFEGNSPRGPREHPAWSEPEALHREARPWEDLRAQPVGDPAPPPSLQARLEGDLALVGYTLPAAGPGTGAAARIIASGVDTEGKLGGAQAFPVEGSAGSFAVQLSPGRSWRGVRACATSDQGVAGETVTVAFDR